MHTKTRAKSPATISAVVIRADGTRYDLGKVSGKRSLWERFKARRAHKKYLAAKERDHG